METLQLPRQIQHYSLAQVVLSTSRLCSTSVNLQLRQIAIVWVCPAPHLYAPLDRLCWQVLLEARSTLERDHSLVDGLLTVGVVLVEE